MAAVAVKEKAEQTARTASGLADACYSHEICLAIDRSAAEAGRTVSLPLD
ncbi:MAG: hypothetical protein HUU20_19470 [Pirellulales bacterium]|nr:hypothetical protein [Pirellulales bacterium]